MKTEYKTGPSRELDKFIERQIRNWEIARQQKLETQTKEARQVEEFVALSRAAGLAGTDVAEALHDRLGWPVFDRQVLQGMAGNDTYRERLYSTMDERDLSWIEECLRSLSGDHYAKNDYFRRLRETVLALARKGHAIFLGRAADLILPKNVGLRVRLEAGREFRISQFAQANSLALGKAEEEVDALEQDRAKFFLHHFGVDAAEPTRHDLIINVERFSTKQAVELIVAAMRLKGSEV